MSNIVAIVGRPNVGKSTLYNRLVGKRQAIVDDVSGVTRDRLYGQCTWNGLTFPVVDTGGFVKFTEDVFEKAIKSQVEVAIEEAAIILFMVDVTTGITDLDDEIAKILRKANKPVFLLVNKVDNPERRLLANEFWSLGFERTFFLASISGSGTGEILDEVVEMLELNAEEEFEFPDIPKIAILGQPNVGKSSLTNALLGEERNIVTDIPGTTRDSIHSHYKKYDKEFLLIDTAGIRRKSKVHEDLEFYSVMRAIRAMEEADVCILMLDATTLGLEAQDLKLMGLIQKRHKGIVIVVNKWDLLEKETNTARDYEFMIKERLAPFTDIPIIFTSVLEKQRIMKILDEALAVHKRRIQKIPTSQLNKMLEKAIQKSPPPSHSGRHIKIKYVTQLPLYYPAFAFFCNHPKSIKQPYRNYLENQLRKNFDLTGVPIEIYFREK